MVLFLKHSQALGLNVFYKFRFYSNLHVPVVNSVLEKCNSIKDYFKTAKLGGVYIKNPEIASSIASCIAKEWNGGYLLEANPGPGLLSSYLLQNGVKYLRVFEKNEDFVSALEVLAAHYTNLDIVKHDLMLLPSFEFRKKAEFSAASDCVKEFYAQTFKDIPQCAWENGTSFQIFSIIANKRSHKFLRYLLAALPNKSTLFTFGRCDFFFLLTEIEYKCMRALPKENLSMYRWPTVLYNIFFDIKLLETYPSNYNNFLYTSKLGRKVSRNSNFYLVKLTPKRDIFSNGMTQEKLQDLFIFVRCHLAKRSDLVIKTIESQWIRFSGPRLIKEGITVFMKFGDLSPSQILWLFKCFSSWPEYQDCNLRAFAHKFKRKQLNLDDDVTEQ